jgi:hypothetical protein
MRAQTNHKGRFGPEAGGPLRGAKR